MPCSPPIPEIITLGIEFRRDESSSRSEGLPSSSVRTCDHGSDCCNCWMCVGSARRAETEGRERQGREREREREMEPVATYLHLPSTFLTDEIRFQAASRRPVALGQVDQRWAGRWGWFAGEREFRRRSTCMSPGFSFTFILHFYRAREKIIGTGLSLPFCL